MREAASRHGSNGDLARKSVIVTGDRRPIRFLIVNLVGTLFFRNDSYSAADRKRVMRNGPIGRLVLPVVTSSAMMAPEIGPSWNP